MNPILVLPGYGNSGADHWQSIWEHRLPTASRLDFGSWMSPVAEEWGDTLQAELKRRDQACVLVAHSLACLVVARHVERQGAAGIAGAFLVAPPDPRASSFPKAIVGFGNVSQAKFSMPAMVVSSSDDPYSDPGFGAQCATVWGARHHALEKAGHINAESGFGDWEVGFKWLNDFVRALPSGR